jgi:hypothetical protein
MKSFNESIKVSVEVDTIANMLLSTMSEDVKHRELITEAIVGRLLAVDRTGMGYLYNSLNGFKSQINFEVGDWVVPSNLTAYGYWTEKSIENKSSVYGKIERAKVIGISEYSDNKLLVEYDVPKREGGFSRETSHVSHYECTRIPVSQVNIPETTVAL